jgi:hypothetical protein
MPRPRIERELGFRIANLPAFDGNNASAKLAVVRADALRRAKKRLCKDITAPGLVDRSKGIDDTIVQ